MRQTGDRIYALVVFGQMPKPIGFVHLLDGAVKRGLGASEYSLFFQFCEKGGNEFWGLQVHRVLIARVTGGRGGASQSTQIMGSFGSEVPEDCTFP